MNQNRCQCSFGKFGVKMEFPIVLQLSDYSNPVVKNHAPGGYFNCSFIRKLAIGKYWLGFLTIYLFVPG